MVSRVCLALAASLFAACAIAAPVQAKGPPAPAAIIPLEPYVDGEHFVFRGRINGQEGLFQFDTGGGLTVLTPQAAAVAGCRPWGQLTGFRMRGDRLDLKRCDKVTIASAGATLKLPTTGIWDLSALLPKDAPPLAGSVGLDAFAGHAVTLDLAGRRLIVETPQSLAARTAHAREVPVHMVQESEGYSSTAMVGLDTPSGRIWLTLDSGNDTPVTIGRHAAALLGLAPDKKGGQTLATTLAGGEPLNAKAYVQDLTLDGNIGAPVLKHWLVTFDVAHGRVWIAPAKA